LAGLLIFIALPLSGLSQQGRRPAVKDSLRLSCLLLNANEAVPEKAAIDLGTKELKLILSSLTDTALLAPADGIVSTIQRETDGNYELVYYHNDYWIWISGITKPTVSRNARIKTGQAIGIVNPGQKIELLLFDFETPADPRDYLQCPSFKRLQE